MPSPRVLLAIALSAALTASCGGLDEEPVASSPSKKPKKTAEAVKAASGCDEAGDGFESDVKLVRCLTEKFWAKQFKDAGGTYQPIKKFIAYRGNKAPSAANCAGEKAEPENAFYCSDGHFIAYDADWMKSMYRQIGDSAVYFVVPHEFGHSVQAQLETEFKYNVKLELQADCYAGATLAGLVESEELELEEGDDDELIANLEAVGDPTDAWWEPDAHGTPEKRMNAWVKGFEKGVDAC
ncbi:neutral zinc metallopeptidase [Microbispora sp. H13382]|uniref:neutral zinc metallopeptidase n=1 Tax=Microbispora sp. H13382 TaxID=2729112 RepID=UPI002873F05E|nr:neutral zinc metallopeptidase [Microbispora sp. H13382]